jgi:transcriptional antiterminator RfaH
MLRWYLIRTKPAAETVAQTNLERQGYEVYLPRLLQNIAWRQQRRERIGALFPRYLFLRLHEGSQALAPVRSSLGVSDAVRFGYRYAIVADGVVRDLRARADPRTGLHRLARPAPLAPGAAVRVTTGPFDGLEGVFERDDGAERSIVLLKLLGQDTPVRIPAECILPRDSSWVGARWGHPAW